MKIPLDPGKEFVVMANCLLFTCAGFDEPGDKPQDLVLSGNMNELRVGLAMNLVRHPMLRMVIEAALSDADQIIDEGLETRG